MILKTKKGYVVTSSKGKRMSKTNLSESQAVKRLAQIEYFKRQKAGKK